MTSKSRMARVLAVLCTILPASGVLAFEPTGNAVADRMLEIFEASGVKDLTYRSATENAEGVANVDGLQGIMVDNNDELAMKIGNLSLSGGMVGEDGTLSLDRMGLSGFSINSRELALTAETMTTTGVQFPSPDAIRQRGAAYRSTNVYRQAEVTGFAVSTSDGLYLPVERIKVENSDFLGDVPRRTTLAVSNVELSTQNLPKGAVQTYLTALGYETIRFDVEGESTWSDTTSILDVPHFRISGSDFADVTWSFKLGGWTQELFEAMTNFNPGDRQQGQELMGKLQATSISDMKLDVANKSVVDRVLDQQSEKAGIDRADYVERTMTSLNVPLTFLKNQPFQTMVSTQLRSFLSDPDTIQLKVAPRNPVPVAQIVGMVAIAPQTLPDVLGVTIEAKP